MKFCPTRICHDACPTRQSWGANLRNTTISPHPQSLKIHLANPRTKFLRNPALKPVQNHLKNSPRNQGLATPQIRPKKPWSRQRGLGIAKKPLDPPKIRHWPHQGPAASRRAQREKLRRPGQLWPPKTLVSPEKALGPPKTPSLAAPRPKTLGFAKNEPLAPPKHGYGPGCAGSGRLRPKRPQVAPKSPRTSQTRALSPAKARRPRPHPRRNQAPPMGPEAPKSRKWPLWPRKPPG